MSLTNTIAKEYSVSPFEILKQDSDEVIMLINYILESREEENTSKTPADKSNKKEKRIRVNDKTASGGWF